MAAKMDYPFHQVETRVADMHVVDDSYYHTTIETDHA